MQYDRGTLWDSLSATPVRSERFISNGTACVALSNLTRDTILGGRLNELEGRSVLIVARDQLKALLSVIELDGVACRIVLCPPDLPTDHYGHVVATAGVDAIVSDQTALPASLLEIKYRLHLGQSDIVAQRFARRECGRTEWILLTSGTTGLPKMVVHTLATLAGAIGRSVAAANPPVWSTFYDIRRYGGLQIALRSLLDEGSLMLSNIHDTIKDFLARAGAYGVTHISGTPSHWRRALMSPSARAIAPQYVRLSGEIVDQVLVDQLRMLYPQAEIVHAFASTEAGVAFDVEDGLAGFPEDFINRPDASVEMKIEEGSLRIRSMRTAICYLGDQTVTLADEKGFVDTGDIVEHRGNRYHFVGRRGGIINVGGLKVHPEEIEAVINRHPGVRMCLVMARRSPIVGALVAADIVPASGAQIVGESALALQSEIRAACRSVLGPHKIPAVIRFVSCLDVTTSGKVARPRA